MLVKPVYKLNGTVTVPGDKSVSHRSVMFGALAKGVTHVSGFLTGDDCLSTIRCFKSLGINIELNGTDVTVIGKGLRGLTKPSGILDVGNSGTTLRLMSGILSGQNFDVEMTGDESIQKRPMKRIIDPLTQMGAQINSVRENGCAPIRIVGQPLQGIHYDSAVASAQVKSSLILANLYADSPLFFSEPSLSRNHTEIMLNRLGANIVSQGNSLVSYPVDELFATDISVPGDISSAAYFIAAGLIMPHSSITICNVGINPTRDGLVEVVKKMGGKIALDNMREESGELVADITIQTSTLRGITIGGTLIPRLIDEIPVIAVMACFAEGVTTIKDAKELKVKESNRIDTMVRELTKMGAKIEATDDGFIIEGTGTLSGGVEIESYHDHRIAMSMVIAALNAEAPTTILNPECIKISYPDFCNDLKSLM